MLIKNKTITYNAQSQPQWDDGVEYIVCLREGIDYDTFWQEMETGIHQSLYLPNRPVRIIDERPASLRSCNYALTNIEANTLINDPRVYCVDIPPKYRSDLILQTKIVQNSNFTKPDTILTSTGDLVNWGLPRLNSPTNCYGTSLLTAANYSSVLDGTGVDVVIQDTGIQADHPEFLDYYGNSRVQQINWFTSSGMSGIMAPDFYTDIVGHGTHIAGIVAGLNYGHAKNSNIYCVKVNGLTTQAGVDIPQCFDVIRGWHLNKPINPITGLRRPTVVNCSWGFSGKFSDIKIIGGSYRGSSWSGTVPSPALGMGISGNNNLFPVRVPSIDVALEELIDAGVHVCIAAGDESVKIDTSLGKDWLNYFKTSNNTIYYYNQGSSPYSSRATIIGSMDVTPFNATLDRKAWYSNSGPGVHLFASGTSIISSMSNTNILKELGYSIAPYFLNNNWHQANLSGTSMACPQVTGIKALQLQSQPWMSPLQLNQTLIINSTQTIYSTELDNDYTTTISLWGAQPNVLYNLYNTGNHLVTMGAVNFNGAMSIGTS